MKIKRIMAALTALLLIGGAIPSVSAENATENTVYAAENEELASSSVTKNGVRYNVYDDKAAVAEVTGEPGCDIVIADDISGKPVTSIEKGAFDGVKDKMKSVKLGKNIKYIRERTFYEFSELTTAECGEGTEEIGNCTFAYCPRLESVSFGKSLKAIDKCAFFSCPSLASVELPDTLEIIDDFAFEMCPGISKVKLGKGIKRIGDCAFKDSSNISEVDLGDKLEYIGGAAFSGENLKCLVIPETIRSIGRNGCPLYFDFSLEKRDTAIVIKNPDCDVISEYNDDYSECIIVSAEDSASRTYAKEENVRYCSIEDYEKGNYDRLTSINDLIELYGMTFEKNETGLTLTKAKYVGSRCSKVVIPDAVDGVPVTAIGDEVFKEKDIQYVYFGENITEVGESAFEGCRVLYMAVLNDKLKTVGNSAFSGCVNMKEVIVGDNIEAIGEKAFFRCSYIDDFKLTDNIKTIGRKAFGRTRIKEMTIPAGVSELRGCPFEYTDEDYKVSEGMEYNVTLKIMDPECKLSYCDNADEWKDCFIISDEGEPQVFARLNSLRHCTFEEYENNDYTEHKVSYFGKAALREYGMRFEMVGNEAVLDKFVAFDDNSLIIPDEVEGIPVTGISGSALFEQPTVKRIVLGNNIKTITEAMFSQPLLSSLRIVDIGDGVEIIEKDAFKYSETLASVGFGKNIKEVGSEAFERCTKLQSVIDLPNAVTIGEMAFDDCKSIKSIELGNSLKTIGSSAFSGSCDYKVLELPDSLEYIGKYAFSDGYALEEVKCGSGLKYIGDYAFEGNSLLRKVTLNEGLAELGKGAFEHCYLLNEVNIPTTLTEIKEDTFYHTCIKSLVLPKSIKSVAENAYYSLWRTTDEDRLIDDSHYVRQITLPLLEDGVSITVLNPDCEIDKSAFYGNFTELRGYKGSTAEEYTKAAFKEWLFVPIDGSPSEFLAGDTNCDGTVDLADAVLIMQALANPNRYGLSGTSDKRITEQGWDNGDVDKNVAGLTVNDAQKIQSYLLGKISSFD